MCIRSELKQGLMSIFLTAVMSATALPAMANPAGPANGGGGNLSPPTEVDVVNAIFNDLTVGEEQAESYIENILPTISDPELKALFEKMVAKESNGQTALSNEMQGAEQSFVSWQDQGRVHFDENGPCTSVVGQEEASVSQNERGANYCFSIPLLTKQVPQTALNTSLFPLVMRETSHMFGADEELATKVESFFSTWINRNYGAVAGVYLAFERASGRVSGLQEMLQNGAMNASQICHSLGDVEGMSTALNDESVDLGNSLPQSVFAITARIEDRNNKMAGFCGDADPQSWFPTNTASDTAMVADGDKKALLDAVERDVTDFNQLGNTLKSDFGIDPTHNTFVVPSW